ncbi:MAG: BPTI/Kunitz domain-containing protein [Bacteroidota bacterium]
MKPYCFVVLIGALTLSIIFSCTSDDDEGEDLETQFNTLVALSESVACENYTEWRFAGIGAKPCGGPTDYIAYSIRIDTVDFLNRLEDYNEAVRARNEREGLISDCALEPAPIGVQCQDGKPVLIYSPCDLEPDVGPCDAAFPRYYFDKETQECKEFIWGGCDGTVPFETMEACRECERD